MFGATRSLEYSIGCCCVPYIYIQRSRLGDRTNSSLSTIPRAYCLGVTRDIWVYGLVRQYLFDLDVRADHGQTLFQSVTPIHSIGDRKRR